MRNSKEKAEIDFFDVTHLKSNLKKRSLKGGVATAAAQAVKFCLQTASTVFLARLLSPDDYGLIGMATVVINFAALFKDLGLATATIQKAEINHKQISTLFWLNFGISCIIAIIIALSSSFISKFYAEPRLTKITLALSISFIFSGLTVQHQALLRRQMQFNSLAKIDIISMSSGVIAAIVAASYELGYWSLVIMPIATSIVNTAGVWIACSWRPGLPVYNSGIGSMVSYGGNLTGFSLVNYFSRNLDNILIGRYWGSQQLGLYAQAYKLLLLPINQINAPITSVALPVLSSLQSEPLKYCKYYYRAILIVTSIGMPIVGFMFVDTKELVLLILGNKWLETISIFRFLLPAALVGTLNVAIGWVYSSLGRTKRLFKWGIVVSAINSLSYIVGVNWGGIGVALAYSISSSILLIPNIIYCYVDTHLTLKNLASTILPPCLSSIAASIILFAINNKILITNNSIEKVLLGFIFYSLSYLSFWILLYKDRNFLLRMIRS